MGDRTVLTRRELELLKLLVQGKRNRQIAAELGLKEQTVKNDLHWIFLKLGVANRTEAAIKVIKQGLMTNNSLDSRRR